MNDPTPPPTVNPAEAYVLAVDLGTGGPKIGLVSMHGEIAWHEHVPVETQLCDDGGAVQHADDWWHAIAEVSQRALASGVIAPEAVVAVCCSGQYASTVPVDASGHPVGDCLLWMDSRGRKLARARFGGPVAGYDPRMLATFLRRSGGMPSVTGADPIGHRLYLAANAPDVARAARWMLEPIDQLTMRFSGIAAATPVSMMTAWLTDTRELGRLAYDDRLVHLAGIDASQLPPLVATGSVVGTVLPEIAEQLGLGPGVAVVTAVPDLHAAALGSGAVRPYQTHLAISTSSWVSCPVPAKKTDVIRQIATVPGLRRDDYLVIDNHEVGGLALQWLRDNIFNDGVENPADIVDFDHLAALAQTAPAGSGNVLFTPWLNGERSPIDDRRARGGFHNLSLTTRRPDMVRAVLEGVAYNSRWLLEAVDHFTGRRLDPIRIIGGGAISDLWCQIHADVIGRVVERPVDPMLAGLRGAGLHAAVALGHVRLDEVADLVTIDRTCMPNPSTRHTYERLYSEFTKLYRSQKSMFHRLNS